MDTFVLWVKGGLSEETILTPGHFADRINTRTNIIKAKLEQFSVLFFPVEPDQAAFYIKHQKGSCVP
jgi:hypothetical protein